MAEQSIAERLREHATDWNGQPMAGGEPAKGDPTAGLVRAAADQIDRLTKERDEAREALAWYATQVELCRKITREGDIARADLDRDGGRRARTALNKDTANG